MKPTLLGLAPIFSLAALTISGNALASSQVTMEEVQAQPLISTTKPYSAIHLASGDDHHDDDDDHHDDDHDLSGTTNHTLASGDDHHDDEDDDHHDDDHHLSGADNNTLASNDDHHEEG